MDILVTGGTGFIGRHFIQCHPEHSYTILSRSIKSAEKLFRKFDNIKLISGLDHLKNLNDYDAVINLAGEPIVDKRWTDQQKEKICRSRWDITKSLVSLCNASDYPPEVFISGSAIGIYGETGDTPVSDSEPVKAHDFASTLCLKWEEHARSCGPDVRLILLRTGVVLGRKGGALAKMWLPFKLGMGGHIGHGQQYMSWIHLDDMVDIIAFLLNRRDLNGPFNLTAPEPVTNQALSQILAKAFGKRSWLHMPEKIIRWLMGESSVLLLASQKVTPNRLLEAGYRYKYSQCESAIYQIVKNS